MRFEPVSHTTSSSEEDERIDTDVRNASYSHTGRYLSKATGYYNIADCLCAANMPANDTVKGLAQGLLAAHKQYGIPK